MKITVLDDYQGVATSIADWSSIGSDVEVQAVRHPISDPRELIAELGDSDIVVANRERTEISEEIFAGCPSLKLVVTLGLRNPVIDTAAANAHGVTVCGTRMLGYPTVELTWALITGMARNLVGADAEVRGGTWQSGPLGFDLSGATLGVAGFGRLGRAVARIGIAFEMEVLVHSRTTTADAAAQIGATAVTKAELISRCDILSIHLPLSPQTRGFVGIAEFSACKPGLRVVNTSRGPIIDKRQLVAALRDGRVAAAALDVYDTEPLPQDDELLSAPNLIMTPHLGYVTAKNYRQAFAGVVEDIVAWRAGSPIRVLEP